MKQRLTSARFLIFLTLVGIAVSTQAGGTAAVFDASDFDWRVVNDTVMGGRSKGTIGRDENHVSFSGFLNTNGGGFASIRVPVRGLASKTSSGMRLRVRGDGRQYTFRLRPQNSRVSYWSEFATAQGEWMEVTLPFTSFWPNWRGRRLNAPQIQGQDIAEMGLMLNDGKDGDFAVEVDWIASY